MLLSLCSALLFGLALGASGASNFRESSTSASASNEFWFRFGIFLAAELPRCHYGDTDCIINVSHRLIRQYARTGYAPAAFPQVEPFLVKRFDISDGRTGSLSLKLNFRDVNVEGLSGVKFDRAV